MWLARAMTWALISVPVSLKNKSSSEAKKVASASELERVLAMSISDTRPMSSSRFVSRATMIRWWSPSGAHSETDPPHRSAHRASNMHHRREKASGLSTGSSTRRTCGTSCTTLRMERISSCRACWRRQKRSIQMKDVCSSRPWRAMCACTALSVRAKELACAWLTRMAACPTAGLPLSVRDPDTREASDSSSATVCDSISARISLVGVLTSMPQLSRNSRIKVSVTPRVKSSVCTLSLRCGSWERVTRTALRQQVRAGASARTDAFASEDASALAIACRGPSMAWPGTHAARSQ
mmetsp:Transcript_27978/g.75392  ORF Transcript_27978/g.75392 Transcript_27978/m.75392 type:complete len:295 (-) Transcript_27978:1345-2229(-)